MTDIFDPDYDVKLAFAGDWHRNIRWLPKAFHYCAENGVNTIIHVGDFGYANPETNKSAYYYLRECETLCARYNITLLWVKGNHEHHLDLNALPLDARGVKPISPHVIHLPNGFRWEWEGTRFTALGGAHSVDRSWRTENIDWFREELITIQEAYETVSHGETDVLITHDCPDRVRIPLRDAAWIPEEDLKTSHNHQAFLGRIVDEIKPKHIIHGHYHTRYDALRVSDIGDITMIHGLDMDKTSVQRNIMIPGSAYEMQLGYQDLASISGETE